MVLAAGLGTRLGALTVERPKPMLEVGGRPILEWVVMQLVAEGFESLAINLHHHGDMIRDHFGDGRDLGLRDLRFYEEPELLGTAGALRNAADFLQADGPFLVQYGDVVTDHRLSEMIAFHHGHSATMTLMVHHRAGSNSVACLEPDGRVAAFLERPTLEQHERVSSNWAFSGICVVDPSVVDRIPLGRSSDLPRDLFATMSTQHEVFATPLDGYRVAVDSAERLAALDDALSSGECTIGSG